MWNKGVRNAIFPIFLSPHTCAFTFPHFSFLLFFSSPLGHHYRHLDRRLLEEEEEIRLLEEERRQAREREGARRPEERRLSSSAGRSWVCEVEKIARVGACPPPVFLFQILLEWFLEV